MEHRLFGPISVNWAGKPLRCLGTMLGYIRGTTTVTGLSVAARLVEKAYPTKIEVTKQQMRGVRLIRHKVCPDWDYTIRRGWGTASVQGETQ